MKGLGPSISSLLLKPKPGNLLFMKGGRAIFIQFISGGTNISGFPGIPMLLFSPLLKLFGFLMGGFLSSLLLFSVVVIWDDYKYERHSFRSSFYYAVLVKCLPLGLRFHPRLYP